MDRQWHSNIYIDAITHPNFRLNVVLANIFVREAPVVIIDEKYHRIIIYNVSHGLAMRHQTGVKDRDPYKAHAHIFANTRFTVCSQANLSAACGKVKFLIITDSKVHGANLGPTWVLSAPDGPMLAPWTLLSRIVLRSDLHYWWWPHIWSLVYEARFF